MIKLDFRDSSINLYDDYIIINRNSSMNIEGTKIYKNEISSFFMDKTYNTSNVRGGSVGASVRIAKGIYFRTSTPYYKSITTTRYTPKIVLKSMESIYFDTILDNDIYYTLYKENIKRFYLWLNCNDLDEFNRNAQIEKERIEKEALNSFNLDYGILAIIWFVIFIISFFSGNSSFIMLMMFLPGIFFLGSIIIDFIKRKKWGATIFTIVIAILVLCSVAL